MDKQRLTKIQQALGSGITPNFRDAKWLTDQLAAFYDAPWSDIEVCAAHARAWSKLDSTEEGERVCVWFQQSYDNGLMPR
jgi:hypothetical protein